ncbi:MAG: hypothetical protein QXH30_02555 [Candidatus Bilamarchaeaceae archaeon]
MADTESAKKEESPSCASHLCGENKVWLVGILGLLVGMLVMYIAMPLFAPENAAGGLEGAEGADATAGGAFVFQEAKAQEIGQMLSDMFYVNTGEAIPVAYSRYEEKEAYAILYYSVEGTEMPVYVSKDYTYLYPAVYEVSKMKAQIAQAKSDLAALGLEEASSPSSAETEMPKAAEPKVELYVMSNCPYGNQAENGIRDVIYLLGEEIAFEPVYILSGSGGKYSSLHGQYELEQDIREKIVYNLYGEKKWIDFVYDVNANCFAGKTSSEAAASIGQCWKEAAARNGIDVGRVEAEFANNFNAIADREVAETSAAKVSGSPTLVMNGQKYQGGRTAEAYKSWICTGFTAEPEDCSHLLNSTAVASTGSC